MTRQVAHIIIEAETPLKVGSNASDFYQDSPVQKDWNGLPMILGTSIAGVLRNAFDGDAKDIFGEENGSKVIFSNALLLNEKGKVCEKLLLEKDKTPFLKLFETLPIREHTRLDDKGVTGSSKEFSKFDEEVVYKGSRFKFSLELVEENSKVFGNILNIINGGALRFGGGSTKGFGKCKIIEIQTQTFDLKSYENYSSGLNHKLSKTITSAPIDSKSHIKYILEIKPDDFFMFGSGFGDSDADMTPVYEKVIDYGIVNNDESKGGFLQKQILLPASSIKGALSHRTAYYYNLQNKHFIDNPDAKKAVTEIFGQAKDSKHEINGAKGKILISDCFRNKQEQTKTFDHVSIDRFTGGAISGALFQEKTVAADAETYAIEILLEKENKEDLTREDTPYKKAVKAFECALKDICKGMLALGGATTKGHGVFCGDLKRGDDVIHKGACDAK